MKRAELHPAERYAQDVLSGRIPTSKLQRAAVERHVRDLKDGHKRGLRFDRAAAEHVLAFIGLLCHSKGEWAKKSFALEPWQQFFVWVVFGWKRADGTRRFRTVYAEVPRKNGKSTLAAAIGLYLLVADREPGAEIYSAATKRDQARIVHSEAVRMVKASPGLRKRVSTVKDNLHVVSTNSKYEPLASDSNTLDGLNLHGGIVDELHAHKTREVWDLLDTATGARRQPLLFAITTAGSSRQTVCWEQHAYGERILTGQVEDDSFFCWICTIDPEDRWDDPATWRKANPNYGVSVKPEDLERKARKAREMPSAENAFRRLHLNQWTEQETRWISLQLWDANAEEVDPDEIDGEDCWVGLDLASTTDIAAGVALFRRPAGGFRVRPRLWVPADAIVQREKRDKVPYGAWLRQGLIESTPGKIIDYEAIRAWVNDLDKRANVLEVAIDRWNASHLSTQLEADGHEVILYGQGYSDLSAPTKELERLLLAGLIAHGGHEVLRWMAMNVAVDRDPYDNIKPSKKRSPEKIDGIVALILALARAMLEPDEEPGLIILR